MEFPIGLPNELGIKGRLFSIAGSVSDVDVDDETAIHKSGGVRASVGFGVSWGSPFGPIRLDFATALRKEPFDRTETLSFGFGTIF